MSVGDGPACSRWVRTSVTRRSSQPRTIGLCSQRMLHRATSRFLQVDADCASRPLSHLSAPPPLPTSRPHACFPLSLPLSTPHPPSPPSPYTYLLPPSSLSSPSAHVPHHREDWPHPRSLIFSCLQRFVGTLYARVWSMGLLPTYPSECNTAGRPPRLASFASPPSPHPHAPHSQPLGERLSLPSGGVRDRQASSAGGLLRELAPCQPVSRTAVFVLFNEGERRFQSD